MESGTRRMRAWVIGKFRARDVQRQVRDRDADLRTLDADEPMEDLLDDFDGRHRVDRARADAAHHPGARLAERMLAPFAYMMTEVSTEDRHQSPRLALQDLCLHDLPVVDRGVSSVEHLLDGPTP